MTRRMALIAIAAFSVNWVIVGGGSGAGARPMDLAWARFLVKQCRAAKVAVFVKQLGSRPCDGTATIKLGDRKGGDPSEWPKDLAIRQMPTPKGNPAC